MHTELKVHKLLKKLYGHAVSMDKYLGNKGIQIKIRNALNSTHQDLPECDRLVLNRQVTVISSVSVGNQGRVGVQVSSVRE